MTNKVKVSAKFSFKGEEHHPSVTLDFDQYVHCLDELPDLHKIIAGNNNIGLYSYEYEMLQMAPLTYSEPEGLIENHVTDTVIDLDAFEEAWHEDFIKNQLQSIIKDKLNIDELDEDPELKAVVLQAYRLGLKHSRT